MSQASPSVVPQDIRTEEIDLYDWSRRQAALIRAGQLGDLDLGRLAEEIDDVGREIYEHLEAALQFANNANGSRS